LAQSCHNQISNGEQMTLKRTGKGVVSIAPTRSSSPLPQPTALPKAAQAHLNHMTTPPPMGTNISNDAVTLLFKNEQGQIGHLANDEGPVEMSGQARRGGQPLGVLATQLLQHHLPSANFNALVRNTHEQRMLVNGRPAGRVTYVLLDVPPSPAEGSKLGLTMKPLSFQPLAPDAQPATPAFLTNTTKRQALQNMAVAALQADVSSMSVQLCLNDVHMPAALRTYTAVAPGTSALDKAKAVLPGPAENKDGGAGGPPSGGTRLQRAQEAVSEPAAQQPAAEVIQPSSGPLALMNRLAQLGQQLVRRTKRGPAGPQSTPA